MVADMVADMAVDMEVHMVTNLTRRRRVPNLARRINVTQFGERVGHGGWLIGPKLFRPEACVSSKLCEFISWTPCYSSYLQ